MNTEWNTAVRRTARSLHDAYKYFAFAGQRKALYDSTFLPCVKICTIFCSFNNNNNNTSVVFIGALARYSSSGALGRNYTRCQDSACLEISDTDLLARSHWIRELLDVHDGVIDIPGLDIDEVLTTINEICCNWFPLCIICKLFYVSKSYHCHYKILMHIVHIAFPYKLSVLLLFFILYSYLNCTCLYANKYYVYNIFIETFLDREYYPSCSDLKLCLSCRTDRFQISFKREELNYTSLLTSKLQH